MPDGIFKLPPPSASSVWYMRGKNETRELHYVVPWVPMSIVHHPSLYLSEYTHVLFFLYIYNSQDVYLYVAGEIGKSMSPSSSWKQKSLLYQFLKFSNLFFTVIIFESRVHFSTLKWKQYFFHWRSDSSHLNLYRCFLPAVFQWSEAFNCKCVTWTYIFFSSYEKNNNNKFTYENA